MIEDRQKELRERLDEIVHELQEAGDPSEVIQLWDEAEGIRRELGSKFEEVLAEWCKGGKSNANVSRM